MTESCPHCGASLPASGDAFCPECRQALDELPAATCASESVRSKPMTVRKVLRFLGWFMLFAGIVAAASSSRPRGRVEDIVDVGFVILGVGLLGASYASRA